ncbi:MAG: hypothetical protein WD597_00135, partial [Balneolaceae bacterium]
CSDANFQLNPIENPSSENSSLPRLFTDNTGKLFMSWVEQDSSTAVLNYATYEGNAWSAPITIAADSGWFVNWADFPSIIAKNGEPVAAHWLDKIPGNSYSYNVAVSIFNGESWKDPFTPHNDKTATEHGFVSMIPNTDSTFAAVWLDGRNTEGRGHHEYSDPEKAMTLRGGIINQNTGSVQSFELDDNVCDCCNTSITKTENGFIAAYRNRTSDEVRDIYTVKYEDGVWSEPKAVANDNWEIAACPVNGPAIDSGKKITAVAWFTGASNKAVVKMSISENDGDTFSEPVIVDDKSPLGRVDLNIINNKIWISWISAENVGEIKIRSYDFSGNPLQSFTIPGFSKNRSSGFPQITALNNGLLVAFTNVSNESPSIKTYQLN